MVTLAAAAEADSLEAFAARLDSADLWNGTDRGELAETLRQALFSAQVSGSG